MNHVHFSCAKRHYLYYSKATITGLHQECIHKTGNASNGVGRGSLCKTKSYEMKLRANIFVWNKTHSEYLCILQNILFLNQSLSLSQHSFFLPTKSQNILHIISLNPANSRIWMHAWPCGSKHHFPKSFIMLAISAGQLCMCCLFQAEQSTRLRNRGNGSPQRTTVLWWAELRQSSLATDC